MNPHIPDTNQLSLGDNRLATVQGATGVATHTYQGMDGLRRSRQEPGGPLTTFVWDGSDYLQERN